MTERASFKDQCRAANERSDIVSVAAAIGMDIRTEGSVVVAYCPFHVDTGKRRNMAFYQDPGKTAHLPRAYCFACEKQATALDLVMEMHKSTIFEALAWLQSYVGISDGQAPTTMPIPRRVNPAPVVRDKRAAICRTAERLWGNHGEEARNYLHGRKLLEVAHEYGLGYWFDDQSGWSRRIVIPYLLDSGVSSPIYTMVGRKFLECGDARHDDEHVGIHPPKYLYTAGAARVPYLWDIAIKQAQQDGYLILTEGELDGLSVLASLGSGIPVASLGGGGAIGSLSPESLSEVAGIEVLFIYDRDSGSTTGHLHKRAAAACAVLRQYNANVRVIQPPHNDSGESKTDINSLLIRSGVEAVQDWLLPELNDMLYEPDRVRELI